MSDWQGRDQSELRAGALAEYKRKPTTASLSPERREELAKALHKIDGCHLDGCCPPDEFDYEDADSLAPLIAGWLADAEAKGWDAAKAIALAHEDRDHPGCR